MLESVRLVRTDHENMEHATILATACAGRLDALAMGALIKVKLPRRADVACTTDVDSTADKAHVSADNSLFLNTDADCRRPCSSSNRGGFIRLPLLCV